MITGKKQLEEKIKESAAKPQYKFYLEARDAVLKMLENNPNKAEFASKYWHEELVGFEYLLDASPLIVDRWRHQCYHISGQHEYDYREHHQHKNKKVAKRLTALTAKYGTALLVPESPVLGGYGYTINGAKYHADTISFFECILAMDKTGLLDNFKNKSGRRTVLEIGSGWGGLTYQFKTLFPDTTYIMVDLPPTLLFSITYLKTLFPNAKTLIVDGSPESVDKLNKTNIKEYDLVFIPHYVYSSLKFARPDLLINRASFQEMKASEVENYIRKSKEWGVPAIYSMNRDRSPHNEEMTSVGDIFGNFYKTEEVFILDKEKESFWRKAKSKISGLLTGKKGLPLLYVHRHIVGRL